MERADKITDENGRVKDGYEARANYIAGELSSALGMEIALTDGVIGNYQQLTGSIHDLIAAKKHRRLWIRWKANMHRQSKSRLKM